jgi:hypothetical protein
MRSVARLQHHTNLVRVSSASLLSVARPLAVAAKATTIDVWDPSQVLLDHLLVVLRLL